nr:receptor-interacting serine/threonine-protein kinase 4-like [Pogona vitticeps]
MQSLEDRRVLPLSFNMDREDDLGHDQLHRNALNQENEILRLPSIRSLLNSSQVVDHNHLQNEFFALKIRNCPLFKAVPLPHIGKKRLPHPREAVNGAASSKELPGLLFSPEKDLFEKIFQYFDPARATGWLERAQNLISEMGEWSRFGDNYVRFAHFWLAELQDVQKQQLLELEMGVIEDEVSLAFLEGLDSTEFQSSELNSVLAAALSEYSLALVYNQNPFIFLDYLSLMSSADTAGYKEMLSNIQYTTKNPQIAEWLLAIRAFALASLWHAIVKFYKALVSTQPSLEQRAKNSVSSTRKQSSEVVKERALQTVQLGYADVLDYLVRNQKLDLGVVDNKNRNLLFLATIYEQSKILDYFLEMAPPIPDINQAAENGNAPLHAAVNTGKMHLVSLLLHYPGINVNVQNSQCDGATPLHLAIVFGHLGICYLLLNATADVESPMGRLTPLQLAEIFGNETIIGLIKMYIRKLKLQNKVFA